MISVDVSSDMEILRGFQKQMAYIQRDAVWWLHGVVPKMMSVKPSDYMHWLDLHVDDSWEIK